MPCNIPVNPGAFSIIFGILLLFAALTLALSYTNTILIIEFGWSHSNQEKKLKLPLRCMTFGFISYIIGAIVFVIELVYSFALTTYVYNFDRYKEENPAAVCEGSFYGLLYVQLLFIQIPFFTICTIFVVPSIVLGLISLLLAKLC